MSLDSFLFFSFRLFTRVCRGECLERVSFFIGADCSYTSVLSLLFPLVSRSARVARLLKMSKVRSSDLETGLSSSDDYVILEATSVSTPYKAWTNLCSFTRMDEQRIRDRFQFLDFVKLRIPSDEERACHSYANEVCFYEADFTSGLRFPIHPFVMELLSYLHLAPA